MKSTVDFIMITELNQILKQKGIEYSLHAISGCACCGMKLRCDGKHTSSADILLLINEYLAAKWLVASYQPDDKTMVYVDSKFDKM